MEEGLQSEHDQEWGVCRGQLGAGLSRGAPRHQSWWGARLNFVTSITLSHPHQKTKARLQEATESGTGSGVRWWASSYRCEGRRKELVLSVMLPWLDKGAGRDLRFK